MAKLLAEISDHVKDVTGMSKKELRYTRKSLVYAIPTLDHTLVTHAFMDTTVCSRRECLTLTLPVLLIDRLAIRAEKIRIRDIPRAIPTREKLTVHHTICWPNRLSQRASPLNTSRRC